jgi:serine/threonine protein kinase
MAEEFRAECKRKRELYKYKLDVDVKQTEEIIDLKSNTRKVYRAEWIKKNSSLTDSKVILTHLIGENAEKLGEINCKLGPHPNVVRTFGRVEHNGTGILLLQEDLPEQTLAQLIKTTDQKFSITILDTFVYQIASALQHLAQNEIIYGTITADNIFVYQFDEIPENILIKLTNIGDLETSTNETGIIPEGELHSEKSDVYAFGILIRELYALELATNDEDLIQRQVLSEHCLAIDPSIRPTFNELTKSIIDLMHKKKFIF